MRNDRPNEESDGQEPEGPPETPKKKEDPSSRPRLRPGLQGRTPNRAALVFFILMALLFAGWFFRGNAPAVKEISYSVYPLP